MRVRRFDLSGCHVNDELGELVRIAWSFAFADGHETMMPQAGQLACRL
jgi:hypothetical protein